MIRRTSNLFAKVIALRRAYEGLRQRQAAYARKIPAALEATLRRAYQDHWQRTGQAPPPAPRRLVGNIEELAGRAAPLPDWAASLADYQLQDRNLRTEEIYYLVDKYVAVCRETLGGKMDEHIVPAVAKALGCSTRTVYNALRVMKEKREAEEAHAKAIEDRPTATKPDSLQ